jgi:hypothetical protein
MGILLLGSTSTNFDAFLAPADAFLVNHSQFVTFTISESPAVAPRLQPGILAFFGSRVAKLLSNPIVSLFFIA